MCGVIDSAGSWLKFTSGCFQCFSSPFSSANTLGVSTIVDDRLFQVFDIVSTQDFSRASCVIYLLACTHILLWLDPHFHQVAVLWLFPSIVYELFLLALALCTAKPVDTILIAIMLLFNSCAVDNNPLPPED